MLHRLRRHPWAIEAHLEWSLAIVYAIPESLARQLIGTPGMEPDMYLDHAFVAAAFVRTRRQRPLWMPRMFAEDFHLAGWRVFVRLTLPDGRSVRGLKILRSDTDSLRLVRAGAWLTHYGFHHCRMQTDRQGDAFKFKATLPGGKVLVDFDADLKPACSLPPGSPFPDLRTARRFAGPMPFTFSHEPETNSIIMVEGSRQHWEPRPIQVNVRHLHFFGQPPFSDHPLTLANAFWVENVPYHWNRGKLLPIPTTKIAQS